MMEYVQLISNVGFPIAMSIFLMVRLEKAMKEQTKATNELIIMIEKKIN